MITDLIDSVVSRVVNRKDRAWDKTGDFKTPYFIHGHTLEITNRLAKKDLDKVFKYEKYPLIALREDVVSTIEGNVERHKLNIAILAPTNINYNSDQRDEHVFKPVLTPLYKGFMEELSNSGLFFWSGSMRNPPHQLGYRKYYGMSNAQKKYVFNDPLDALEIMDLQLNVRIDKCL